MSARFLRSVAVPVLAMLLPAAAAADAASAFTLEAVRSHRRWGPFALRDGIRVEIAGKPYHLRVYPPDRLSFISLGSGRVFGPVQAVEGRLVEIDGAMYVFSLVAAATPVRSPPSPPPSPPPRPEPIPLPEMAPPQPAAARPALPPPADETRLAAWADFISRTPIKWEVDGRRGRQTDLERTSLGGSILWRGWSAAVGVSGDIGSNDILPRSELVESSELDNGRGWTVAGGYHRPFLREGGWEVYGGARGVVGRDSLDLVSRSAISRPGDGNIVEWVHGARRVTDVTLTEWALWLDAGLAFSRPAWGVSLDLSMQPAGRIDVDGGLPAGDSRLRIGAERDQPLLIGLGFWTGFAPWRFFGEVAGGAETRGRAGISFDFR